MTGPDLPYGRVLLSWRGFIVVAGNFLYAGDVAAPRVAAWDGMSWWPLCGGLNNWAEGLAPWNEGVVAGGWFSHVATGGPVGFGSWAPDPTRWPSTRTISIGSRDPGTPWVPHLNPDACSVDPDQTNRSRVQVPRPVDLILRPAMEAPDAGG